MLERSFGYLHWRCPMLTWGDVAQQPQQGLSLVSIDCLSIGDDIRCRHHSEKSTIVPAAHIFRAWGFVDMAASVHERDASVMPELWTNIIPQL